MVIDTIHIPNTGIVCIKDFGAKVDGITDDFIADSTACYYCLLNPKTCTAVYFPVGHTRITKPLFLGNSGQFFTIQLIGAYPAKEASDAYLSEIDCDYTAGFGIGIQLGRGIVIKNLAIKGRYTFPYTLTNKTIGSTLFSTWNDGSVTDTRFSPYAGISIDPYPNASGSQGGTSGVEVNQCLVYQWMVGAVLSPSGTTANAEMINFIDCDIENVRVAIAICQDQSKEIHIDRLKSWGTCHTILDGVTYGNGTGGGSVMIEGMNIAGNVNQLFNLVNDRFPLSAKDIYSESTFKIGSLGGSAGATLYSPEIDFIAGPGMPAPDYLIQGGCFIEGGSIRYYDGDSTHRLNLVNTYSTFRDMTLGSQPITVGLYGAPQNTFPVPTYENVHNYVTGRAITANADTLIRLPNISVTVNQTSWTASYAATGLERPGDYVLGAGRGCLGAGLAGCPTIQLGRCISIINGIVTLDDVGVNAPGKECDSYWVSRVK